MIKAREFLFFKRHFSALIPLLFLIPGIEVCAQDTQFSQYYNVPLYLNPAFTGTGENTRFMANYRNQWAGLGDPFVAYSFSFDHQIEPAKSGVGLLIKKDRAGVARLASTDVSLFYSYLVPINDEWVFKPALQFGFGNRNTDFTKYTFGDQLDNNGGSTPGSNENFSKSSVSYADFSTGGLLYNETFWMGLAVHHLNEPNLSFYDEVSKLPAKVSIHSGLKLDIGERLGKKDLYLFPTFNYKHQAKFDQLDLGMYLHINNMFMTGLWYRGIPINKFFTGFHNSEAFIVYAGLKYLNFNLGYSYDITISKLSLAQTKGAHEISLMYEYEVYYRKKKKIMKKLPCPNFDR